MKKFWRFIYLLEREHAQVGMWVGSRAEGEGEKVPGRIPTEGGAQRPISWPCGHDLNQIQESEVQPTEPPRHPNT